MQKFLVKIRFLFLLFICLSILESCSSERQKKRQARLKEWMQDNGKVKILSTTAFVDDLVRQIGKEHVDGEVLIQGELDPHSYQLIKGDDEKLAYAQIIFYNGLHLEHGPSLHTYLMNSQKAISLGDRLDKQHVEDVIVIHGQKDPHIWMDVALWKKTIPFIVEALSQKDPNHAAEYRKNGNRLELELDLLHLHIMKIMHQVPPKERFLVTSHDAFNYFTRAYLSDIGERETGKWKKRFAAPEGLAPESQLSAIHIQEIISYLKENNVHCLFPESNVSQDSIRKVVQAGKEQGLNIIVSSHQLYGDAIGAPGSDADSYAKMMEHNAKTLSEHMNCKEVTSRVDQ